jgi:tripartite-type tricarboxylate transporter receptor subunit TctC
MTVALRATTAAMLFSLALLPTAHAQNFPTRPVTIIVASTPGGGTDIIGRLIADQLSRQLGQSFIVENKPGAGSVVGTVAAAKAAPDGYTLNVGLNASMAVNPSVFKNLAYDPVRDFTPVAMLASYPFLVVVNNDLPVKSITDLIALGKAKPGQINYASAGIGTGQHLSMELFKMMTGTNFVHVAYRGAQPAYVDVMSGRVPVFFDNMSGAMKLAQAGKVRAIAITSKQRSSLMPEVPTVAESGLPGYEYHTWFGLWAPAKTPKPVIEKLHGEVVKALADKRVHDRIIATAGVPSDMPLADITPFVKSEIARWHEVAQRAGIKPR